MEAISLHSSQADSERKKLGQQLAALHTNLSDSGDYGASFDNYIGGTPQSNSRTANWGEFYVEQRLGNQFRLAEQNGLVFQRLPELDLLVDSYFGGREPIASSLLHGDLWSGNCAFDNHGSPVLFDPASYFGDREADIAFTKMFGGFSTSFYQSYRREHPAPEREVWLHRLYNFYHELNHFNLFGGGYADRVRETIGFLLKK